MKDIFEIDTRSAEHDCVKNNGVQTMDSIDCDKCGNTLEATGALAFSPPSFGDTCTKYHFCRGCWNKLKEWMYE